MNLTSASSYSRSNTYSQYADLPVDRDLERISADLRALPTPADTTTSHSARRPWLQRHLHLRRAHA